MKRLMYTRLAGVAVTALALALAGCGGSDNVMEELPEPTAEEKRIMELEQQLKDEQAAKAALEAEKEQAEKERDMAQGELDEQQREADLAAAKALFSALALPRATAGNPANAQTISSVRDSNGDGSLEDLNLPAMKSRDGMMFEGKDGTTRYTAMVRSTQTGPTTKLFGDSTYAAVDGRYVNGVYFFGADDPVADKGIKSDSFPQTAGTFTYGPGGREFAGTFHGAKGMYACSASVCTAEWTEDGIDLSQGSATEGRWTFTPDDGARITIPDRRYQSYGWWLQENADGTVDAGPVHFLSTGFVMASGVTALEGTAEYKGPATGKYSIYSGAFSERSEAGHFTADAKLMADFGNSTENGRISGMIENFVTASGAKDDWMVSLEASGMDATDGLNDTGAFSGKTVWTIGEAVSDDDTGTYIGNMYENGSDLVPKEVGGTFDAKFEQGVGRMVGAFAATLPRPDDD